MGERTASLSASNGSGSACYLDGFAAVTLRQDGAPLDLRTGTTSSEQPGRDGRATRVGLAPGDTAHLLLFWRGYGAAADTTTPQALDVVLPSGGTTVRVDVTGPSFDLIDGGELAVGNWLPGR
jgi:hypothetical protein